MANTAALLAAKGVSMQEAFNFVSSNLTNPQHIFNVAKDYGVTIDMLAEIARVGFPEVGTDTVRQFFFSNSLNPDELTPIEMPSLPVTQTPVEVRSLLHTTVNFLSRVDLDASNGAYQYVFDMMQSVSVQKPTTGAISQVNLAYAHITGFGADDSILFINNSTNDVAANNINGNLALGITSYQQGKLGVNLIVFEDMPATSFNGVIGFNALPVGDVFFG